jgi:NAD(P)-dependent dehydrogenase (short-subunit alcohol dehydrogenase family)
MKKTVLITGASEGIGFSMLKAFLAKEYNVVNMALHSPKEPITGAYRYIYTDLNDLSTLETRFDEAKNAFGAIDILIHNAAAYDEVGFYDLDVNAMDKPLNVNVKAPILLSKLYAKQFHKTHGRIIIISSTRSLMSEPNTTMYTVTKGALNALTHSLSMTLQDKHITVNAILPGWINSKEAPVSNQDHAFHPSNRVGKSSDIASMALYLADEANDFINASHITIDGGVTKKMIYPE